MTGVLRGAATEARKKQKKQKQTEVQAMASMAAREKDTRVWNNELLMAITKTLHCASNRLRQGHFFGEMFRSPERVIRFPGLQR